MPQETKESNTEVAADENPIRPLLVVSDKTLSEYEMFIGRLLVGLADESVSSALVSPRGWEVQPIIPPSIEVIKYPAFNLPVFVRNISKGFLQQLTDFGPTVIHCLCEKKVSFVKQLARQLDLPYILTINSLQKRFSRLSLYSKLPVKITVPAKSIAENISKSSPKLAGRVKQINIGIFIEKESTCFSELSRQVCIVTAGALNDESDFENLLRAVKHLALEEYEFMLFIIGTGPAEQKLRRLIAALGLTQVVTIVPNLRSRRSVLASGDIFVQPRPNLAFNPLLLEAMSAGTAVAACKGGVDDLIIDNETAVVFKPDDELSIMNGLRKLLNRPEYARQLASTAQDYVKENHKVSTMVSEILQTYRNAQETAKV
ncbi:glycosyltransferase family 4 protein [Planctomycetota bacterium]